MIGLPSDVRFDFWRSAGRDLVTARLKVLDAPLVPSGVHPFSTQLLLSNNQVFRGTVDAQGTPTTILRFTKSLFELLGSGPSGTPGWSWPGSRGLIEPEVGADSILANVDIEFPALPAPEHNHERGFHGPNGKRGKLICLNVRIFNADNGLVLGTGSHAQGIVLGVRGAGRTKTSQGYFGHYGYVPQGAGVAIEDLDIQTIFHHDYSIQNTKGCVACRYKGVNFRHDFHATSSDEEDDDNLFAFGNVGLGTRMFSEAGSAANKPWTGDRTTFHDLRKGDGTLVPSSAFPSWVHQVIIPSSSLPPPPPPADPRITAKQKLLGLGLTSAEADVVVNP